MNLPEVKQFRVDVSGKSPENLVPRERIPANDERSSVIIVPRHAPFFILSLQVYAVGNPNPLVKDEDYDFTSIDDELSEFSGAPIGWTIRKLKQNLPDLEITYQTLGTVPVLTKTTKSWYESASIDKRPVWFDQLVDRPEHYIPKLHGHDLEQGFYYFQRLVRFYEERLETLFGTSEMVPYRDWFLGQLSNLESYMIPFRTLMNYYVNQHYSHDEDPHRTTSRKVPGLDLIDPVKTATLRQVDAGESEELRTLTPHATRVINETGISVEDHVVPQFDRLTLVGKQNELNIDRVAYGLGDLKVSCWINEDGQGDGLAEFWDEKGPVINKIVNSNPLGLNSLFAKNQWKNTHVPFKLEGVNEPVTRMISGGNGKCHIVGTKDKWYCRVSGSHRKDLTPKVAELVVSGDFVSNWSLYQVTIAGDEVWLTRTSDYLKNPTLIWYVVKLSETGKAVLSEYTFSYKTLNDNTPRNDSGKVVLFPRGFTGGKYTSGDLVFSKGVDLEDIRQAITLLPAIINNELYVEFILPEAFTYNGVTRKYAHAHMAKCKVDNGSRKITLTYTDPKPRPYVQTDLLFRPVPDAASYFEQIACQFPVEMSTLSGAVVMMDREGFFGFGYGDKEEGNTFAYTFMPELYIVKDIGRFWYLDEGTPWSTDYRGTRLVKPVSSFNVNHPSGLQPYFGVTATSEKQQRTTMFKGWDSDGNRSWFVKSGYDGVDSKQVLGVNYSTSGFGGYITKADGMSGDLYAGVYLDDSGSEFFMSAVSSENEVNYLPMDCVVTGSGIKTYHYLKPTEEFLALFGVTPADKWTLLSGHYHGFPDVLYVDRLVGNEVRSIAHVFTLPDEVYTRVDAYYQKTPVTLLGKETINDHQNKVTSHTLRYGVTPVLIDGSEVTLHAGSVNVYKNSAGELTVSLSSKNQVGDVYVNVNLNTTLILNPQGAITHFDPVRADKHRKNTYLTKDLGWVDTSVEQQSVVKGLINLGEDRPNMPAVPTKAYTGNKLSSINTVLDTQYTTFYPPNIMLGEHQDLITLDWLSYDFRPLVPAAGEVNYSVIMEIGYQGPYLWVVKGNVINDGIVVIDTVTLNGNGIK